MRSYKNVLSFSYGSARVQALAIPLVIACAAFSMPFHTGIHVMARNETAGTGGSPASASLATYNWNLGDQALPLISLPDRIGSEVDLSLTYSIDEFQFPLFQTLYYNRQAGKYILMVISPKERRAEFISLVPAGDGDFRAEGNSRLRLADYGSTKVLRTVEGTVYTFGSFGDGEFHCSEIKDRSGAVINFTYNSAGAIKTIEDAAGRTVTFTYVNEYVSAITQIWGDAPAKLRKTWAVTGDKYAETPEFRWPASPPAIKRIPTNATTLTYTEQMAASDWVLATVFGGRGAVAAANGFEPAGLGRQYPLYRGDQIGEDGRLLRGHLSHAMHLYGSADGTRDTELYVPAGFVSHTAQPTPTDAAVTFYYPRLGNLTDVTLAVFHIANFHLSEEDGHVRVGNIGGKGGSLASYRHSHLEFYRGNTGLPSVANRVKLRIDPASVFAATPHSAMTSKHVAARHALNFPLPNTR